VVSSSEMKARWPYFAPECLTYTFLLCGGIAAARTPDRIRTIDSKIAIDRDRTMHVEERLEIVNAGGTFDVGIHRRLKIRPAGPERAKAGSFESIEAQVDGRDAIVQAAEQASNVFDIAIGTNTGTLSRDNHIVELRYLAKNQFFIYDDFEDLGQSVTGEWPVTVEKATVELTFSDGLPEGAGISADTAPEGERSVPRFDCVRKDLPNGVRFETTHSIMPGERLFVSARFAPRGYFVSNVKEGGFRAVRENHPLLVPGLISLCGSIVLLVIGIVIWRRAPGVSPVADVESTVLPRFWREVIRIYFFPIIMYALAIVPGLNFTYSGHGGFSWLIVPLCFPWVTVRILIKIARGSEVSSRWYKTFFKVTIPSYVALSLPLSLVAVTSIRMSFGLEVSTWAFFAIMVSPFPWWYFT
jgi:hypothetical protein